MEIKINCNEITSVKSRDDVYKIFNYYYTHNHDFRDYIDTFLEENNKNTGIDLDFDDLVYFFKHDTLEGVKGPDEVMNFLQNFICTSNIVIHQESLGFNHRLFSYINPDEKFYNERLKIENAIFLFTETVKRNFDSAMKPQKEKNKNIGNRMIDAYDISESQGQFQKPQKKKGWSPDFIKDIDGVIHKRGQYLDMTELQWLTFIRKKNNEIQNQGDTKQLNEEFDINSIKWGKYIFTRKKGILKDVPDADWKEAKMLVKSGSDPRLTLFRSINISINQLNRLMNFQ